MSTSTAKKSLFSAHWYRVRDIAPWLASDVQAHRHVYRGEINYVLHRPSVGSHYRLDANTYELIDRLDGEITVDELWHRALADQHDDAPRQDELLGLLAALYDADLLQVNKRQDTEHLFARQEEASTRRRKERLHNPLYLRFSLFDPDLLLNHSRSLAAKIFSRPSAVAAIILWLIALVSILPVSGDFIRELLAFEPFASQNIVMFLLVYPVMKLLHELGHALAVKRCGGEVHEMGIALIVLLPLPFVDASASNAFAKKSDRMLVDSAGILVELTVTALATLIWIQSQGVLHQVAMLVMTVGGISTLFFNGNPLLKFDGYYLLADYLEIPNMAERAKRLCAQSIRFKLLRDVDKPTNSDTQATLWLYGYGVFSALYRIVLMLTIAWMLSEKYFLFGALLSLWVVLSSLLLPCFSAIRTVAMRSTAPRLRRLFVLIGLPALLLTPLVAMPFPMSTTTRGIVWLPEDAVVRAPSDCEITKVLKTVGEDVRAGDTLFICDDPELLTRQRVLQAMLDEVSAQSAGISGSDPVEYARLLRERNTILRQIEDTSARIAQLTATSAVNGRFGIEGSISLLGQFLNEGDIAAYVVPKDKRTIKVALTEKNAVWMDTVLAVKLRVGAGANAKESKLVRILRQAPKASRQLPSAGLGSVGGGELQVDPDGDGTLLIDPAFDIELEWPKTISVMPVGTHVQVKFQHDATALAIRFTLALRHALMGRQSS